MPHYTPQDEANTQYLHPSLSPPRKGSLRPQSIINNRRSTNTLRGPANGVDEDAANGRHSLAHELAVALMPEPSAGSKLLAEEFGIEFDEGAEGIDADVPHNNQNGVDVTVDSGDIPLSFADELGSAVALDSSSFGNVAAVNDIRDDIDPVFASPKIPHRQKKERTPEQDAMQVLAENLESTDKFLGHLRTLDIDVGSAGSQQPALERIASDVIRRINDTVRDREGQVRELLGYEREFRKIAGELGGSDVLGQLDELESIEDLSESAISPNEHPRSAEPRRTLDVLMEEEPQTPSPHHRYRSSTHDWELDPHQRLLGDEEDEEGVATSPVKDSFPTPPPLNGPTTPGKTVPQLAHLRSFTSSLVTSLTTISEQAQVNGAATTEAGRKIRALKNKLGGWRMDWDSAERSRMKIERWEAGFIDGDWADGNSPDDTTSAPRAAASKRVDGRKIVAEHLQAFELSLADAARKTQAIMAR